MTNNSRTIKIITISMWVYLIYYSINNLSIDSWFMIASGEYIVENGIPYENPWFVKEGLQIVIQQWLSDVYLYYLDKLGNIAMSISIIAQWIILIVLMSKLIQLRTNINKENATLISTLAVLLSKFYIASIRAETITIILVVIELIAIEKYKSTNKVKWLSLLLVTMIFEINLHASFWILHILVVLAYIVPVPKQIKLKNNRELSHKQAVNIVVWTLISSVGMLINPYGIKAITYLPKALTDKTFQITSLAEVNSDIIWSYTGLVLALQLILVTIKIVKKDITSVELYMTIGLIVLQAKSIRNIMLIPIVLVYIADVINLDTIAEKLNKHKRIISIACNIIILAFTLLSVLKLISGEVKYEVDNSVIKEADYILDCMGKDGVESDTPIYVNVNMGGYLEYRGFNKIYMDYRPEIYNLNMGANDNNILIELNTIFNEGLQGNKYTANEEVKQVLEYYNFEYIIAVKGYDYRLLSYLYGNQEEYQSKYSGSVFELWKLK